MSEINYDGFEFFEGAAKEALKGQKEPEQRKEVSKETKDAVAAAMADLFGGRTIDL